MTEIEAAIKIAQAKHLARLTGPPTCCVKVGPANMPCGCPVEYKISGGVSGWRHASPVFGHNAVPASYAR